MPINRNFLSDAQLRAEIAKCEHCAEKPCKTACPGDCLPADFIMAATVGGASLRAALLRLSCDGLVAMRGVVLNS